MDKKNCLITLKKYFIYFSSISHIIVLIIKVIAIPLNTPGAQGGTGGW